MRKRNRKWTDEDILRFSRVGGTASEFFRSVGTGPTTYNYRLLQEDLGRLKIAECLFTRRYRPRVKDWTKEELQDAISKSSSISEIILRLTGRKKQNSGQWRRVLKLIEKHGLDLSGLPKTHHERVKIGTRKNRKRQPDEVIFANGSVISNEQLRRRYAMRVSATQCAVCGLRDWMGEDIEFQLDHHNGNRFDNRLENLRWLCPNCHSQTSTFCRGVTRPDSRVTVPVEQLQRMVEELPIAEIARELSVHPAAIIRKLILKGNWGGCGDYENSLSV